MPSLKEKPRKEKEDHYKVIFLQLETISLWRINALYRL